MTILLYSATSSSSISTTNMFSLLHQEPEEEAKKGHYHDGAHEETIIVRPKTFDPNQDYSAFTLSSAVSPQPLAPPPSSLNNYHEEDIVVGPVVCFSSSSILQRQNPSPKPMGRDFQVVASVPVGSDLDLLQDQDSVLECLGPLLGGWTVNKRPTTISRGADNLNEKIKHYFPDHLPAKRRRISSSTMSSTSVLDDPWTSSEGIGGTCEERVPKKKKDIGVTDHQAALWDKRFHELVEFQRRFGHCLVPHKWSENLVLATWVKRQRYQWRLHEQRKRSTLIQERRDALSELGFVWDSHNATWEERFNELVEYKRLKGHTSVPSTDKNHTLSVWVQCQRRQWKLIKEEPVDTPGYQMKQNRIERLEAMGFIWEPRKHHQREQEEEGGR
jgi:hypothetical protein